MFRTNKKKKRIAEIISEVPDLAPTTHNPNATTTTAIPSTSKAAVKDVQIECKNTNKYVHSPREALTIFLDMNLTRDQYNILCGKTNQTNLKVYPPYSHVLAAKKLCYPISPGIDVTDAYAEIKLQELLDQTSRRLIQVCQNNLSNLTRLERRSLKLTLKYGCDGTSELNMYK